LEILITNPGGEPVPGLLISRKAIGWADCGVLDKRGNYTPPRGAWLSDSNGKLSVRIRSERWPKRLGLFIPPGYHRGVSWLFSEQVGHISLDDITLSEQKRGRVKRSVVLAESVRGFSPHTVRLELIGLTPAEAKTASVTLVGSEHRVKYASSSTLRLQVRDPGEYQIFVKAEGFVDYQGRLNIGRDEWRKRHSIVMVRERYLTLRGLLLEEKTKRPVADASTGFGWLSGHYVHGKQTNKDGEFRLDIPWSHLEAVVRRKGTVTVHTSSFGHSSSATVLAVGELTKRITILVERLPSGVFRYNLTGLSKEARNWITAYHRRERYLESWGLSSGPISNGGESSFAIDRHVLVIVAPRLAYEIRHVDMPDEGTTLRIDRWTPESRLSVTVIDESTGSPIVGARVQVQDSAGRVRPAIGHWIMQSDNRGVCSFEHLRSELLDLHVTLKGHRTIRKRIKLVVGENLLRVFLERR